MSIQPTEKKISLWYMNVTCIASLCLTIADFISASGKFCKGKVSKIKASAFRRQHFDQEKMW